MRYILFVHHWKRRCVTGPGTASSCWSHLEEDDLSAPPPVIFAIVSLSLFLSCPVWSCGYYLHCGRDAGWTFTALRVEVLLDPEKPLPLASFPPGPLPDLPLFLCPFHAPSHEHVEPVDCALEQPRVQEESSLPPTHPQTTEPCGGARQATTLSDTAEVEICTLYILCMLYTVRQHGTQLSASDEFLFVSFFFNPGLQFPFHSSFSLIIT